MNDLEPGDFAPRDFDPADMDELARVWHAAWHDGHADYVPTKMLAIRDLGYFQRTLPEFTDKCRVVGPVGAPVGLCVVIDNRIDRLFIAAPARGKGLARVLIHDAEARIAAQGHQQCQIECVEQNTRAAGVYEHLGYALITTETQKISTEIGMIMLDGRIYRKNI